MTPPDDDKLEPWTEFIKRATHIADETIKKLNMQEWTVAYWRKQWRWAERIANQPPNRWSRLALEWNPTTNNPQRAQRKQGRPQKRWDDEIINYLRQATHEPNDDSNDNQSEDNDDEHNSDDNNDHNADSDNNKDDYHAHHNQDHNINWLQLAQNSALWRNMEDEYVQHNIDRHTKKQTTKP